MNHSAYINLTAETTGTNSLKSNYLSSAVTAKKIKFTIKNFPQKESPVLDGFTGEFCQSFKELTQIPHKI